MSSNLDDKAAGLKTLCEVTAEGLLRDAAELGWELAMAGATLEQARVMAADASVQPTIAALVNQIMTAGDLISRVARSGADS